MTSQWLFTPPRQPSHRRRISLTPLIDVVFILLVFFMLASSFLDWRAIDVSQAMVGAQPLEAQNRLVVQIDADTVVINGDMVAVASVGDRIQAHVTRTGTTAGGAVVRVEVAEGVSLQRTMRVLDQITAAGATMTLAQGSVATP